MLSAVQENFLYHNRITLSAVQGHFLYHNRIVLSADQGCFLYHNRIVLSAIQGHFLYHNRIVLSAVQGIFSTTTELHYFDLLMGRTALLSHLCYKYKRMGVVRRNTKFFLKLSILKKCVYAHEYVCVRQCFDVSGLSI